MSFGDKIDYCDAHLEMLFNEGPRAMVRDYPGCPACLREKYERDINAQVELQRAKFAIPKLTPEMLDNEIAKVDRAEEARRKRYSFNDVKGAVEDRGVWESMHLGNWTFEAKYQREEVEKMLRRGEISEARAQELLREVKDER